MDDVTLIPTSAAPEPGAAPATAPAPIKVVDRDAGENYGTETLALLRPFKRGGVLREALTVVIPDGAQMTAFVDAARGRRDGVGLMLALAGLERADLDGMYAADRGALDVKVGAHISLPRPLRPPGSSTPVDIDAREGYGREAVTMARPFKWKGQTYSEIPIRVPTGLDVARFVDPLPSRNAVSADLMANLSELSVDVFDNMYALDRVAVELAVGKHL